MRRFPPGRRAELLLILAGLCVLSICVARLFRYAQFQRQTVPSGIAPRSSTALFAGTLHPAARFQVPRLGLSVLVVEGDENQALEVGAAHLAGTAAMGGPGNAVIAGHRDTAFRSLRGIRIGDTIRIDAGRTYEYTVSSIRIVQPDDVSVLQNSSEPELTVITCFPFYYVGAAPRRFVVRAHLNHS